MDGIKTLIIIVSICLTALGLSSEYHILGNEKIPVDDFGPGEYEYPATEACDSQSLFDKFIEGEIEAIYPNPYVSSVFKDFESTDPFTYIDDPDNYYLTNYDKVDFYKDVDNDGEDELILSGIYGGIYLDARDGKVYVLAEGTCMVMMLSCVEHNGETLICYSDVTHTGRQTYFFEKYEGGDKLVDEFNLSAEYYDEDEDHYSENSTFTYRNKSITMEEYESVFEDIFGYNPRWW